MTKQDHTKRQVRARSLKRGNVKPASQRGMWNERLLTIASVGLLFAAVGQVVVSVRQTGFIERATRLQLAEAKPRLKISPSEITQRFGDDAPGSFVDLPSNFNIELVSGIDAIFSIDAPITLHVSDTDGATSCYIEVRGLYVQNDDRTAIDLFSPPKEDFSQLVRALHEKGIEYNYPRWDFVVRYYDLYGDLQINHYDFQLNPGSKKANGLIFYHGVWSGGEGFYFDENSTPATDCPSMASQLNEVIAELGGHAGNI